MLILVLYPNLLNVSIDKKRSSYISSCQNKALRSIIHNLSSTNNSSFKNDLHKGLYFDYIMSIPKAMHKRSSKSNLDKSHINLASDTFCLKWCSECNEIVI